MSNRSFEVGDLVVSRQLGVGKFIGKIGFLFCAEFKNGEYCFDGNGKGLHYDVSIKHIRKPRPGNTESRAIVARLAKDYHKIFLHNLYHHRSDGKEAEKKYWQGVKDGSRLKTVHATIIYKREKSMLK